VMLLSGTLADLDLASIAATTSLGRSSLRLDLRGPGGDLIGSLVLKAGRVVSATAGATHGREALRVMMSASRDARFQLARESRELADSAVASVEELGRLRHRPIQPRTARPPPIRNGGPRFARASSGLGPTARSASRVQMMQGRLDEFDLLTLLQSIGVGRQLVELEIRNRAGAQLGAVRVKSGKVVSAHARGSAGVEAIFELIRASESFEFTAFRVSADLDETPALASVAEISFRFAGAALQQPDAAPAGPSVPDLDDARATQAADPPRTATRAPRTRAASHDDHVASTTPDAVMEGRLSEYDVRTLLEVLAATRQHARLQILDPGQPPLGEIALKAGRIVSSQAGILHGREAIAFLLGVSPRLAFRVLTGSRELESHEPLGTVQEVLASIPSARSSRAGGMARILRWALPLSLVVGGGLVVLFMRDESLLRPRTPERTPIAARELPAPVETNAPPVPAEPAPPPRTEPVPAAVASQPSEASPPPVASQPPDVPVPPASPVAVSPPPAQDAPSPLTAPDDADSLPARPAGARAQRRQGIQNAQSALKQLGYNPGPIDNVYGRRTRIAIVQFQRAQGLPATGFLDRETWSALVAQLIPPRSTP
jgi:hypothetical protein